MSPARWMRSPRIVPLDDNERARIEREVQRHRRFIPVMVREFLTWEEMAKIEVNAPDLPGIVVDVGTTRIYPFSDAWRTSSATSRRRTRTTSPTIRCCALPGMRVGRAGMEKFHDLELRGRAGAVQLEVNAVGRVIRELDRQEGAPGDEVGLTIDVGLQQAVLNRLGDESACAVVMDCRNGEVLAMATNPSFDPSPVQLRRQPGAVAGMDERSPHAADQQGDGGPVRAWLHFQDGGGAGGTECRGDHPRRRASIARAISTWAMRASTAGARAGTARSTCAAG